MHVGDGRDRLPGALMYPHNNTSFAVKKKKRGKTFKDDIYFQAHPCSLLNLYPCRIYSSCARSFASRTPHAHGVQRSQCPLCGNLPGPVWEPYPGVFNGFPPAADVSWRTAAAVFTLVGRVCCVSTCLTRGAAHAQSADTLIPFVSYRPARKHVNRRAVSGYGVFLHTWTRNTRSRSRSLHFYHQQEFLFFAGLQVFRRQNLFLESICQLFCCLFFYGSIIPIVRHDWTALPEPFPVPRSVSLTMNSFVFFFVSFLFMLFRNLFALFPI